MKLEKVKKRLQDYKVFMLVFCGLVIVFDIFVLKPETELTSYLIISFWLLCVWLYDFDGEISALVGLGFFLISALFFLVGAASYINRLTLFGYLFLLVGIVHLFVGYLKNGKSGKD